MDIDEEQDDESWEPKSHYSDPKHPKVEAAANRALRTALAHVKEHALSISDFWDVFAEFTTRHQYERFIDLLSEGMKNDLREAIRQEYSAELRREARDELVRQIKEEFEAQIYDEISESIRDEIAEELRENLTPEVEVSLRAEVKSELKAEIRAQVEAELKVELMSNPDFVEEVKKDIKRKLFGL
jgi:hypothetical protein